MSEIQGITQNSQFHLRKSIELQLPISENVLYFRIVKIALIVFFISDCLNKLLFIATNSDIPIFTPSLFARMVFEVIVLNALLIRPSRQTLSFIVAVLTLFLLFTLGLFSYLMEYKYDFKYFYHLSTFNKYIFVFIVYHFLVRLRNDERIERLMSLCGTIFILNSLLAILGFIFKIQLFKSYPFFDYRFGYNGVIPAVNESSLFYFIALSYLYYKKFVLKESFKYSYLIVIASLLLGTKAIYGYILALVLFHFVNVSGLKSKIGALVGISVMTVLFLLWYFSEYSSFVVGYFSSLIEKRGVVSALLSGRDDYLATKFFLNTEYWSAFNWLFGGQDQLRFLIEMDLFDMFLMFGIVGSFLYLYLFFTSVFSFSLKKKFNFFFVLFYFVLATLGGHFFVSALNSLYLVIFCLFIYHADNKVKHEIG